MKLMEIKGIVKCFGGLKAVNKASFSIEKGKITALIGPNGSGKTTLFNVVSQLLDEDEGTIMFKKIDISKYHPGDAYKIARHGISRTFQEVRLFKNLTIRDHIAMAMNKNDENLFRNIFDHKAEVSDKEVQKFLDIVGLKKPLDTLAQDLSYGQRKLLDLAMAIAQPHELLLLDEPVAGVNPLLRGAIKDIVRSRVKEGDTILLIEHDMNFVMNLADYVYVIDYGKIIAEGTPKKVQNNPKVLEAYLGD